MKIPSSVKKLLENKYVLYIVFFLAVANLFGYMVMGNYKAIALFVLVGYLVHNFNKNMILVLGVPLILTSLFTSGFIREGAVGGMNTDASGNIIPPTTDASGNIIPPTTDSSGNQTDASGNSIMKPLVVGDVKVSGNGAAVVPGSTSGSTSTSGSASGSATPEPVKAPFSNPYKGNRLDYAATVEDAYGDLNNILGGDGIKNLTADTQKLMEQQLQLANAMKSMTPLLEQAKSLIGGFDMKNFGNITEMAKQFKASGSN
jgi:hypothetical protein